MMRKRHLPLTAGLLLGASFAIADPPQANVVFYSGSPLLDPRPRVFAAQQVEGYTTAIGVYNGANVSVQRLLPNVDSGFGPLAPLNVVQALPGDPAQYFVATNQFTPRIAAAYFGEPGVYDAFGVEADPPGGTYLLTQRLSFYAPVAGTQIEYRIDGGPFQVYGGESIFLTKTTTVDYRGTDGIETGPLKSAMYVVDMPVCADTDGDEVPDLIEVAVGLDPLVPERDSDRNRRDDLDEILRGSTAIGGAPAPDFANTDDDAFGWSDYDEFLRGTNPADPLDNPVAQSLNVVELQRSGTIEALAIGSAPPATPEPTKPYPDSFRVTVLTPSGHALADGVELADNQLRVRASGERIHLVQSVAKDGSGRSLPALVPPKGLCIDTRGFCHLAGNLAAWRDAYRAAYVATIFDDQAGFRIDPRSTAEALLLNRYYELEAGAPLVPGDPKEGPDATLVAELRAGRNEAELVALIKASVTPAMVDLVSDYYRFATVPSKMPMMEQLAAHFGGREVDPELIPEGVRESLLPIVVADAALFAAVVPDGETMLTGTVSLDDLGEYRLQVGPTSYRLEKLSEPIPAGRTATVRAVIDSDDCGGTPVAALVVDLLGRDFAAVPPPVDSDGDGLSDDWELYHFANLAQGANGDPDGDGLSNEQEQAQGKNPNYADADPVDQTGWMLQ